MKKNKLYKVNKWNQPAFMVDRMHHNIFDGFSGSTLVRPDMFEHQGSYQSPTVQLAGSSVSTLGRNAGNEFSRSLLNNKPATIDNAPQAVAPKESGSKSSGFDTSAMMSFGLSSIPTTPIEYNGTTYRRGAWDLLDPTYQLSGAKSSEAGDILSDMGVASTKTGDPWTMMTGSLLKQAGSVVNALWGSELNEDNIKRVEDEITGMNRQANVISGSENNEDYMRNSQGINAGWNFTQGDIGEDGLFAHKAEDTYNDLKRKQDIGRKALRTGIVLGARSADRNIDDAARRNFVYAYGGPLGQYNVDDMGAIEYGFMSDYLTQKKRENDMKSKMSGIVSMPAFMPNSYAIGGDTDESAASQLARGWYDGTIGGFVNMGKIVGKEVGKLFSSDKGNFGGGSYNGAGRTSRWKPAYKPKNKDNFNKAFDEARKAGAETFMFGDKEYSTTKEANPVREFNNRHVGAGRTEEMIRQRGTYGRDFGPITGRYSLLPVIPYALGGDLQANGGDFSTGLVHINAGLSHEENPNGGVQLGVDNENVPNLVEEGERIFNDYVYSKRIFADGGTLEKFHLSKKRKISFADLAELLEKESAERPNDPISLAGLKAQMSQLADEQERQKQEMEAERAKAAFEALSPEEQTALMQQKAEQEAIAQQQAAMQQPTPEELAIAQQQQQMADGSEAALGQEPQNLTLLQQNVNALGGELVRAGDVEPNRFDYGGKKGSRKAKRIARKYDEQWFKNMAKSLGISDKEMEGFVYSADDPEANLIAFNNIYRDNQYNKSRDTYRASQRQSKKNELFGDKGLYRMSDDGKKVYKALTNSAARDGWITADYRGNDMEDDVKNGRFISDKAYQALSKEEKEKYHQIHEKAGDRMYDFYGKLLEEELPEDTTMDGILDSGAYNYDEGFKWDDKDAQTLQYPVDMEHSATSAMRYIPTIGGAIGLANDIFSSPDYSRPQAIIDVSRGLAAPSQVQPHYIGNYLTYRPLDILYAQNAMNAQSRATDRALMNTSGGNRGTAMAGLLANGYNSQLASGNLLRQAQEYNDALKQKVEDFNRGTDTFNANADMDSQKTNAMLRQEAGRLGLQGLITGYGMMDDIDARRQASMNANLTNVLQSLGNIGEEAYDEDRLRWLERTGTLKSRTLSANGGKLKKKRGLTI